MVGIHWVEQLLLAMEEEMVIEKSLRKDLCTWRWESGTGKSRGTEVGEQGASFGNGIWSNSLE